MARQPFVAGTDTWARNGIGKSIRSKFVQINLFIFNKLKGILHVVYCWLKSSELLVSRSRRRRTRVRTGRSRPRPRPGISHHAGDGRARAEGTRRGMRTVQTRERPPGRRRDQPASSLPSGPSGLLRRPAPDRRWDHGERRAAGRPPPTGAGVRGRGRIGHRPAPAHDGTRPGTGPQWEVTWKGGGSRPVSRVLSGAAIHLRRTSPCACSDLPGSGAGHASPPAGGSLPYLVLLRVGFALPPVLPPARCALTAPFHPCRAPFRVRGGLFSVALSVGSRPPGVTWHPALRSPDFPPPRRSGQRLPGRLPPVQCDTGAPCFKTD